MSGLGISPWAGSLPDDWEALRARWQFRERNTRDQEDETLLSVRQDEGVIPRDESDARVWNPGDDVSGYKLTKPGDFVISLRSFEGGFERSAVRGIVSPAYTPFFSRALGASQLHFLAHFFKSQPFISSLQPITTGIRQGKNISFNDFGDLVIPVPPDDVANAIASFLDRETEKIDTLIEKKRRLLELLEEKRTALITRAVTKGLDPDVPMKDSGVEWIGKIPEHREVRRLKTIALIRPSSVDKKTLEDEHPVRLCNYTDVYYGDRIESASGLMAASATSDEIARFRLREGDVIITKDSESADDIAVPAFVARDFKDVLCGYHLDLIRPRVRHVVGRYLFYAFLSRPIQDQFRVAASGITRYGLSVHDVGNACFPLPPRSEQLVISRALDDFAAQAAEIAKRVKRAISLLQEYRTALISAAVTGKIDVRDKVPA